MYISIGIGVRSYMGNWG